MFLSLIRENVLRYFLFCCFTGLRYGEIRRLKYSDIYNNMISIEMEKVDDIVKIPLIDRARNLIPERNEYFIHQTIFKVLSDQLTNRYLKDIMKIAGIQKSISFHCSRHTFATNTITIGMPIEVVSKLLGHKDLKTTMIYAKIEERVAINEMKKWS